MVVCGSANYAERSPAIEVEVFVRACITLDHDAVYAALEFGGNFLPMP